jgi:integrase
MGTVRKKPSGSWEARYRDPAGRTRGKSFRTKREAERFLERTGADMQRGDWLDPRAARTTFRSWATDWMATKVNLREGTRVGYESLLEAHVLPAFSDMPAGRIDKLAVQGWVAALTKAGLGAGTVRNAFGVLRQVLGAAVDGGALRNNPCFGVDLPRVTREEMFFATHDEIAALADAIAHPVDEDGKPAGPYEQYALLVKLDAYTGLRFGELAALRRRRVDIKGRRIQVAEAVREVDGRLVYTSTKTYETRSVPLPGFLVEALADHLAGLPDDPDQFVFTSPDGGPLRNGNFRTRHFVPAVQQAGLSEGFRIHDVRHTFAAFLIAEGGHPLAVTKRLGHSSIQVTHDRYGHLFKHLEEGLTDALDAAGRAARRPDPPASSATDATIHPIGEERKRRAR